MNVSCIREYDFERCHNNYQYANIIMQIYANILDNNSNSRTESKASATKSKDSWKKKYRYVMNDNGKFERVPIPQEVEIDEEEALVPYRPTGMTEKESKTRANIKLIQKLTTYLPQHLVGKAKEQIKQMSNVDKIEEFQGTSSITLVDKHLFVM